ncbi:hypothetical protein ACUH7Y_07090 [Clostridium beijerinckii]|uniref:Prophage pi2 protein 38 n=1 Tax=Clostridium beijerinckii TaxID=1520 RepID=A0A7X9XQS2_CLOBE|nr:hypothetical protein [Clostridium beijerinckii]NMF06256.1 hypothetical protein [Clostridium beijerinckii]
MTLSDIYTILKATGYPVAYSHFIATPNNPLPTPPYITYLSAYSSNMFADDIVYMDIDNLQIELYTAKKDPVAEKKITDLLKTNGIAYQSTEDWIESEQLFQKIYEVRLI